MRFTPGKMAAQAAWYRERGDVDTAERLEAKLVSVGACRICGRGLTDPLSLRRGIGPDCWAKVNRLAAALPTTTITVRIDP